MSVRPLLTGLLAAAVLGATAGPAGAGTVVFSSTRCEDAQDRERRGVKPVPGIPPETDLGCISALWMVSDDGTGLRRVTDGFDVPPEPDDPHQVGGDGTPAWSGDGKTIVFTRIRHWLTDTTTYWTLRDGKETQIPVDPPSRKPTFPEPGVPGDVAPDGSWFVFASNRGLPADGAIGPLPGPDIWTFPITGGAPTQLTSGPDDDISPGISPDGKRIFFMRKPQSRPDLVPPVFEPPSLYAMNPDGSGMVRLTAGAALIPNSRPSFSPDGSYVLIALTDGLYTVSTDGTQLTKRLTSPLPPEFPFRETVWAGEGPKVVLVAGTRSPTLVRADLSLPVPVLQPLTPPGFAPRAPDWTPGASSLDLPLPLPDVDPPVVVVTDPAGGVVVTPPPLPTVPAVLAGAAAAKAKPKVALRRVHRATLSYLAIDATGLKSVQLSVSKRVKGGRCAYLGGTGFGKPRRCTGTAYRRIDTQRAWKAILERLPDGKYRFRYRTTDVRGKSATTELPLRLVP